MFSPLFKFIELRFYLVLNVYTEHKIIKNQIGFIKNYSKRINIDKYGMNTDIYHK